MDIPLFKSAGHEGENHLLRPASTTVFRASSAHLGRGVARDVDDPAWQTMEAVAGHDRSFAKEASIQLPPFYQKSRAINEHFITI
jgi:hypothetical protein